VTNLTTGTEESRAKLRKLGVMTPTMIKNSLAQTREPDIVDGLIAARSVNLVVGDSGLGKTPLLCSLAAHICTGQDWLGRSVQAGSVLYADAESSKGTFFELQAAIAAHMKVPELPENFFTWPLNWSDRDLYAPRELLTEQIAALKPSVVFLDPLRSVVGIKDTNKNDEVAEIMNNFLRPLAKVHGCAFVGLHHRRKQSTRNGIESVNLFDEPLAWFSEVSGSGALVNYSDLRLGIEPARDGVADLIVGGFRRSFGALTPMRLARDFDDATGEPLGYRLLTGASLLTPEHRQALGKLSSPFKFSEAQRALGTNSGSGTKGFINACLQAQVIRAEGTGKQKNYLKIA
jgi:hypothetical protein